MEETNQVETSKKMGIPKLEEYIPTKVEKVLGIISFVICAINIVLNAILLKIMPEDMTNTEAMMENLSLMLVIFAISILSIVFMICMFILPTISMKGKIKRDSKAFKTNFKAYIKYLLPRLILTFVIFNIAFNLVNYISNTAGSKNQLMLEGMPSIIVIPIAILYGPFIEEFLFRGILRRWIKNDNWLFVIISGILFGLTHTLGVETTFVATVMQTIPYALMGGCLAYIYAKSDNMWNNIIIHFVNNLIAVIVMMVA